MREAVWLLTGIILGFLMGLVRNVTEAALQKRAEDVEDEEEIEPEMPVCLLQRGASFTACGLDSNDDAEPIAFTPRRSSVTCETCLEKMDRPSEAAS